MTKTELIIISTILITILCLSIAVQLTEPKPQAEPPTETIQFGHPTIEEPEMQSDLQEEVQPEPPEEIPQPEPLDEPYIEPIEPIHEEGYIRYELTPNERLTVERVVMAETGNQNLNGQIAVAQCILNTAEAENMRPDDVVLAPNQYAKPVSADAVSESVKQAVSAVFDLGITVGDEPIRFFYAPKFSSGTWHEANLEYVFTIQDHKFFKVRD